MSRDSHGSVGQDQDYHQSPCILGSKQHAEVGSGQDSTTIGSTSHSRQHLTSGTHSGARTRTRTPGCWACPLLWPQPGFAWLLNTRLVSRRRVSISPAASSLVSLYDSLTDTHSIGGESGEWRDGWFGMEDKKDERTGGRGVSRGQNR